MRVKVTIAFVVVAVLVLAGLVYQNRNGEEDREQVVRIAYLPSSSCLPLFVALEKGYFKDAGITVEKLRFTSTNGALNAVLSGRADGTPGFGLSSFCAIETKNRGALKIYLPCVEDEKNYANKMLVPVRSRARSIEDLDGKKVGTYTSSTQLLYLQLMMRRALPPGHKWEIVQVDEKLQLQLLASGRIDALFTVEPNGTRAINEGLGRVLVENPRCAYIFRPFPAGANCFSSSFITSNPELARKTAAVFIRAAEYINANPEGARALLPKYTPLDKKTASDVGLYTWCLPGQEDYASLQKLSDLLYSEKLLTSRVKIRSMWYTAVR